MMAGRRDCNNTIQLLSLITEALTVVDVNYGAGRHETYLMEDPAKLSYGLYINFISQPFFLVAVVLVKVSVGLFLLRITPSQTFHRFIWGMIAFMAMYTSVALSMYIWELGSIELH